MCPGGGQSHLPLVINCLIARPVDHLPSVSHQASNGLGTCTRSSCKHEREKLGRKSNASLAFTFEVSDSCSLNLTHRVLF